MRDLSCRTAHLWLQAPDELSPLDARQLERHLAGCGACNRYRLGQVSLDRVLLRAVSGTPSVRGDVMARLRAERARPAKPPRSHWTFFRRTAAPALLAFPLALVVVLAALLGPRVLNQRTAATVHANPWHPQRIGIGFPLAVDPVHPDHLLAGAWGGVYQSWDAGNHWRPLAALPRSQRVIRDLAIDAADPRHYLVATLHSVVVSRDAGQHWQTAVSGLRGVENMFLLQSPQSPHTFYVGPSVLWRSVNGGGSWQQDGMGRVFAPDGIQSLATAPNGTLFTAIWQGGVAVSHDGGQTWQRRAQGLAPRTLDVAIGSGTNLWAATARGIYHSADEGLHWQHAGPHFHFFTTSVIARGGYVLAGGNGGVLRSVDGGRHWSVQTAGLPLAPYVFGFIPDPSRTNRVYASLDGDGLFRSDNGGITWKAVARGLPITGDSSTPLPVLFLRGGTLWHSDGNGSDPGNLTIETQIHLAAVAPDGGAASYLTGNTGNWGVRVMSAYGSAVTTLATGTGTMPRALLWAPNASQLAITSPGMAQVVDVSSGHGRSWAHPRQERPLGWARDAQSLLFWNRQTGEILTRSASTGTVNGRVPGVFRSAPLPAPDGQKIAMVHAGVLSIHFAAGRTGVTERIAPSCRATQWSADSTRLLLACPGRVLEYGVSGRLMAQVHAPRRTTWVPGSHRALLYFQHGALWRWEPGTAARVIVPDAHAIHGGA